MSRPRFRPTVYVLEKENHFVTKVSTNTTDEYPKIVFLRAKVRITPLNENKSYEKEILSLKSEFEGYCKNLLMLNSDYDKNYIFSIDIAEKSVKYKKTSHLHYDIFLKPKHSQTLLEHKNKLEIISNKMDDKLTSLFKKYDLLWKQFVICFVSNYLLKYIEVLNDVNAIEDNFYNKLKYGTTNQEEIVLIKNGFSVALAKIIVEKYKKFYKINFHDCSYELNEDVIDEMKKNKENGIIIYETRGNIIQNIYKDIFLIGK